MQGCNRIVSYLLLVLTALLLTGPLALAGAGEGTGVICADLPGTAGLALDNRGYAYTVDCAAGKVLCVPPDGEPVVYARITAPTALAVDELRTLFVGTAAGDIYAVTLDGSVSRVHRCPTRVSGLSLDRDGNLLIATTGGAILRLAREDFRFEE